MWPCRFISVEEKKPPTIHWYLHWCKHTLLVQTQWNSVWAVSLQPHTLSHREFYTGDKLQNGKSINEVRKNHDVVRLGIFFPPLFLVILFSIIFLFYFRDKVNLNLIGEIKKIKWIQFYSNAIIFLLFNIWLRFWVTDQKVGASRPKTPPNYHCWACDYGP